MSQAFHQVMAAVWGTLFALLFLSALATQAWDMALFFGGALYLVAKSWPWIGGRHGHQ
ncbi:hypothetical protein PVT67_11715 [Gallaecimonas kandeliae]|uniref:hypothetical protein n=1 Tax=Gallaecimonas kandeliae TaxID=3029055 RepID=UPI002649C516|nr:hypothetical protein [Gallaecimonas kandeliae]WKE64347.1 hypothetical protein PVT67_11715 [Gallaecimonas kandeliae]